MNSQETGELYQAVGQWFFVFCSTVSVIPHALLAWWLGTPASDRWRSVFPSLEPGQDCGMAEMTIIEMPRFVYSFTRWWIFGCFQFGDITHKATMNICVQVIVWKYTFFFLGLNGQIIWQVYGLIFRKLSNSFCKMLYHFTFPPEVYESSSSSTSSPTFSMV